MARNLKTIAALFWFAMAAGAQAQITYDGCRDINGVPVASVLDPSVNDIAMATILAGRPVIRYNPNVVMATRSETRLFFYAHECGHHALGHVLSGIQMNQEQQADCWAIRTLRREGLLDDDDITAIQGDLAEFGRGDWTHLPGPQRAINLRRCLRTDGGPHIDQDVYQECMDEKVERCIAACTTQYGYNYPTCQAQLCAPGVGLNTQWEGACRRRARQNE